MRFPRLNRKGRAPDWKDLSPPNAPMTPGTRTLVAVIGMWLGSLTLSASFLIGGTSGMNRSEVAALLKALAQLVALEEEDLRRAPTYPGGPVDPIPHNDQR